ADALRGRRVAAGLGPAEQEEALAALRAGPFADAASRAPGLARARTAVQQALSLAHKGDRNGARRVLISAYLDHFAPPGAGLRAPAPRRVQGGARACPALR